MKTKPRWMKSVIETAEKYASASASEDQNMPSQSTPHVIRTDHA